MQITKQWHMPVMTCFEGVFTHTQKAVDELLKTHFQTYKQLHSHVSTLVNVQIQACKNQAIQMLTKMLELETVPVFTQNLHYLDSNGKLWLRQYSEAYHDCSHYAISPLPVPAPRSMHLHSKVDWHPSATPPVSPVEEMDVSLFPEKKGKGKIGFVHDLTPPDIPALEFRPHPSTKGGHTQNALSSLYSAGHKSVTADDLSSILTPHQYREELLIMAKVRAYFQVAYKRIIDYIPLAIEHELNQALANRLQESLFKDLIKEPRERLEELLCEDPVVASKRKFLQGRVKTLGEMQIKLANFRRDTVM
jgi:hypothetical protein